MARRKKPEGLTEAEEREHSLKEVISNNANRSEKTSWNRKMDNMVKLMALLLPIEEKIILLQNEKIPLFDQIQELRLTMVNECIHPYSHLVVLDNATECKFCGKKMSIANASTEET